MKKLILLSPLLLIWFSCTYEKGEIPKPDLTCIPDPTLHTIDVTVGDDFFEPLSVEILSGDTVKWTYVPGASVHTTTCDGTNNTTLPAGGETWNSDIMLPGDVFKKALTVAGTYNYICTIHGMTMMGTIVVKDRCP
jgi:plastocyanin